MKRLSFLLFLLAALSLQAVAQTTTDQDAEIAALKKQIAEKQLLIRMHKQGNLVPYVHFERNSAVIGNNSYDALDMLAKYIKSHPKAYVEVRAYASGDEQNVRKLCEDRTKAVIKKLVEIYNVKPSQLHAVVVGQAAKLYAQDEFNRIVTFNDNNK